MQLLLIWKKQHNQIKLRSRDIDILNKLDTTIFNGKLRKQ